MLSDATEYMDILFAMLDEVFAGATSRRTGRKGINLDHNRVVPTWACPIVFVLWGGTDNSNRSKSKSLSLAKQWVSGGVQREIDWSVRWATLVKFDEYRMRSLIITPISTTTTTSSSH